MPLCVPSRKENVVEEECYHTSGRDTFIPAVVAIFDSSDLILGEITVVVVSVSDLASLCNSIRIRTIQALDR